MNILKVDEITPQEYNVAVINNIKNTHKDLRQASKGITFALTYQGTWRTLVSKFNIPEAEAKLIEQRYHELYKESDDWVKAKLDQAAIDGYITCAFGLKLRTPLLKNALTVGNHALPEALAELRTAGNALGQSWCLLNCRSSVEVMEKVWASPYSTGILPVCQIHDALYFFVKDDLEVLTWFNKVLIKAMEWQEAKEIAHPQVKLGGDLEIFYPNWAHGIEIPNNASKEEIIKTIKDSQND